MTSLLDDLLKESALVPVEPSPEMLACFAEAEEGWLGDPSWPSLFLGGKADDVLIYCELSEDPDEDLALELLSAVPDVGRRQGYATWLEHELDEGDLSHILDPTALGAGRLGVDLPAPRRAADRPGTGPSGLLAPRAEAVPAQATLPQREQTPARAPGRREPGAAQEVEARKMLAIMEQVEAHGSKE